MPIYFLDDIVPIPAAFDADDLVVVCGAVGDFAEELYASERAGAPGARRQGEYSSGRRVARQALRELGLKPRGIPRRERSPVWPEGVVGSITHSDAFALAALAKTEHYLGIGIDIEPVGSVTDAVAGRVLLEGERAVLPRESGDDADGQTLLFSAKESVYKAVHPLIGEYLGYTAVELEVDWARGRFRARTVEDRPSSEMVQQGIGYFEHLHGHWLTVFLVKP